MTETFVQHCITMYNALNDRARTQVLESGLKARVFAGSYSEAWEATGISRTYYSSIRKSLERHNAIQVLQRGGRGADTVIVLNDLPTEWDVSGWLDGTDKDLTPRPDYATLEARVEELEKLLGGIDVVTALADFQSRVETLEAKARTKTTSTKKEK